MESKIREFLLERPEVLIEALEDAIFGRLVREAGKDGLADPQRIEKLLARGRR